MATQGTFAQDTDGPRDHKEHGLYWGVVTDNKDPEGTGRVRARIPGINNVHSTWARPVGNPGGGGQQFGVGAIPKIGATILVGFIQGSTDEPVYWPGPPPIGQAQQGFAPDNIVLETESFRIVLDETPGAKKIRIETLLPGKTDAQRAVAQSYIELAINDGDAKKSHTLRLHAPTALVLTSSGGIVLDAPTVTIKRRPVQPSGRGI